MIIRRKYVGFDELYEKDPEAKKIIKKAIWDSTGDDKSYYHLKEYSLSVQKLINLTNLGCGF